MWFGVLCVCVWGGFWGYLLGGSGGWVVCFLVGFGWVGGVLGGGLFGVGFVCLWRVVD
jgi:hypothetical protein